MKTLWKSDMPNGRKTVEIPFSSIPAGVRFEHERVGYGKVEHQKFHDGKCYSRVEYIAPWCEAKDITPETPIVLHGVDIRCNHIDETGFYALPDKS